MTTACIEKVKRATGTADNRSRAPIGRPVETRIFLGRIGRSYECGQRRLKDQFLRNFLRGWWWGSHRCTRGDDEDAQCKHAHLLGEGVCAISRHKGSDVVQALRHFNSNAISTAPTAASSPLLSIPGPLRSIACCSVFTVSTPNMTGIPVAIWAS